LKFKIDIMKAFISRILDKPIVKDKVTQFRNDPLMHFDCNLFTKRNVARLIERFQYVPGALDEQDVVAAFTTIVLVLVPELLDSDDFDTMIPFLYSSSSLIPAQYLHTDEARKSMYFEFF
jgi:hypothetical protein